MNRVALALTKLWLRLLGNKFLRVSTITLPGGIEQQVVVFSSKTFYMVGQVTPWGTILVHEFAFLSEKLRDYVVVHESAHKRQWFRHALYPLMTLWLLWPIVPLVLLFVVLLLIQAVTTHEAIYAASAVSTLIAFAVVLAIPTLFSWILEFLADCHAIRELGMSSILDAMAEGRALAKARGYKKPDLLSLMLGGLTRPHLSWTYHFCRFLHRNEVDPTPK